MAENKVAQLPLRNANLVFDASCGGTEGDNLCIVEDDLRSKWAVGFSCLLLFVEAVKTIPNSLAINPPAKHGNVGSFTLLKKQWYGTVGSGRLVHSDQFSIRLRLDEPLACISTLPRIQPAADTCPTQLPLSDPRFA